MPEEQWVTRDLNNKICLCWNLYLLITSCIWLIMLLGFITLVAIDAWRGKFTHTQLDCHHPDIIHYTVLFWGIQYTNPTASLSPLLPCPRSKTDVSQDWGFTSLPFVKCKIWNTTELFQYTRCQKKVIDSLRMGTYNNVIFSDNAIFI